MNICGEVNLSGQGNFFSVFAKQGFSFSSLFSYTFITYLVTSNLVFKYVFSTCFMREYSFKFLQHKAWIFLPRDSNYCLKTVSEISGAKESSFKWYWHFEFISFTILFFHLIHLRGNFKLWVSPYVFHKKGINFRQWLCRVNHCVHICCVSLSC